MSVAQIRSDLEAELLSWWDEETTDWDAFVTGEDENSPDEALWGGMPVVDSKAVARTTPLFERHLGIPLDVKLIKPGGYGSIESMIDHLVPKMIAKASDKAEEKQTEDGGQD